MSRVHLGLVLFVLVGSCSLQKSLAVVAATVTARPFWGTDRRRRRCTCMSLSNDLNGSRNFGSTVDSIFHSVAAWRSKMTLRDGSLISGSLYQGLFEGNLN